jgi:hypothetical protein
MNDNRKIQSSFLRSQLLEPENFGNFNLKLVQSLTNANHSSVYRKNCQSFLTKIMIFDDQFVNLCYSELNMKNYIQLNILREGSEFF